MPLWLTDAEERAAEQLAAARADARHAAEDTRAMYSETDAVIETVVYGLLILICVLLAVLAATPTN